MGKGSTEIQHDIERQRHALTARVARLDRRIHDDIDETKATVAARREAMTRRITDATHEAQERATAVGERISDSPPGRAAAEHPGISVAAALGTGVALGYATGGGGGDHEKGASGGHQEPSFVARALGLANPGHLAAKAAGSAASKGSDSVKTFLQVEVAAVAKDIVDGVLHPQKSAETPAPGPEQRVGAPPRIIDRDLPAQSRAMADETAAGVV